MARSRIALDGLPHSEISGSKPVCGSPKLIAAYHVLHRLLAPRHPPYALSSLTKRFTRSTTLFRDSWAPRNIQGTALLMFLLLSAYLLVCPYHIQFSKIHKV